MRNQTERRRLHVARQVVATVTTLLLVVALGVYLTGNASRTFSDLGMIGAAGLAATNCALAARSTSGRLRVAWSGFAGACASWAIGQSVWSWYELVLRSATPFPGLADVGFLLFPVGAVVAIAVFPANASRADLRRMTLDGLMAASAIVLVSWGTTLGAVIDVGGPSLLATTVSVTYPVSDIVLLVVCVLVLSRSKAYRVPLALVGSGLALMAMADSGFAYLVTTGHYATGSLVDLGWFFAFGLLAYAPLARGATTTGFPTGVVAVASTMLPYVPLGGVVVFVAWRYSSGARLSAVEEVLTGVVVLLVLLRQFLTARDNQRLAVALAAREGELLHQAFHDPLTGLANRALFVDRLAHALELHRRDGNPLAICFLDLDGFKAVNDSLGHSAGDDLLREVSARFHRALSNADTLARFGGDEFAVLLESRADPEDAALTLLGCLRTPFTVGRGEVSVLASIGVAQVDPLDPTPTVEDLLARADLAMYTVKRRGKAGVLLHREGLEPAEADDAQMGASLAQALADGQLAVEYQPIVELSTGRLDTVEALARWASGGRPVPPDVFVPVAERHHLIEPLFRFVLGEACTQVARWSVLPGGSAVRVAVNVSPTQLSSPQLPLVVAAELAYHGLTGDRLVLEITESEHLLDTTLSDAVCRDLRGLGVQLSLDDFGTGLSTLARLRDLPVDEVKIDRSFIAGIDRDGTRRRFVAGVLAFADQLGLTVVAEGVERTTERDTLTELGCHRAQGFLFSVPVAADSIDALLARSPRRERAPRLDQAAGRDESGSSRAGGGTTASMTTGSGSGSGSDSGASAGAGAGAAVRTGPGRSSSSASRTMRRGS